MKKEEIKLRADDFFLLIFVLVVGWLLLFQSDFF